MALFTTRSKLVAKLKIENLALITLALLATIKQNHQTFSAAPSSIYSYWLKVSEVPTMLQLVCQVHSSFWPL